MLWEAGATISHLVETWKLIFNLLLTFKPAISEWMSRLQMS